MLARLEVEKGVDVAIRAAAAIPELDLVVAGDGSCRATLEATAAELGIAERIHFLGYRTDPAALLANADLFVLPSLVEGFPLSVVEAMAAGVPVVASDIGGTREAVEHERTGLLVRPRDADALAAAIRRTLSDPAAMAARFVAPRDRATRELSAPARIVVSRSTVSPVKSFVGGPCQPSARRACCSGRSTDLRPTPVSGRGAGAGTGWYPVRGITPQMRSTMARTVLTSTGPATVRTMFSGVEYFLL